jgi:hypothetical protein
MVTGMPARLIVPADTSTLSLVPDAAGVTTSPVMMPSALTTGEKPASSDQISAEELNAMESPESVKADIGTNVCPLS